MQEVVDANREFFKASSQLSNSAKMLSALMTATGEYEAKRLAEMLDIPIRTIQRLKVEISTATHGAYSANAQCAISVVNDAQSQNGTNAISATHGAKNATRGVSLARADSSKTTLREKITVSQSREDANDWQAENGYAELKAICNGSTEPMIADVMRFMGLQGDREHAIKWLVGTVAAHGHERTIEAWTIVTTKSGTKELGKNPLAFWSKTAGGIQVKAGKAPASATGYQIPDSVPRFAQPATEH